MRRYAPSARTATLSEQTVKVGIQNKNIRRGLLVSLLAAKSDANIKIARIQNRGEIRLSTNPPATAASPVALVLLVPEKTDHRLGTSSARTVAVKPAKSAFTVTHASP
jgi:hypothetical protein